MVNYSFTCPFPCTNKINVEAENRDDAARKIVMAGAMSCRNLANHCYCEKSNVNLYPIPEEELRNAVNHQMRIGN